VRLSLRLKTRQLTWTLPCCRLQKLGFNALRKTWRLYKTVRNTLRFSNQNLAGTPAPPRQRAA
jgi:hypothetical protein